MKLFWVIGIALSAAELTEGKLRRDSPYPSKIKPDNYDRNKTDLVVYNVVNYGGFIVPAGPVLTEGIRIAINAIETSKLLPDYNVVADVFDDECDHSLGVGHVTQTLQQTTTGMISSVVPVIVGPVCGENEYTGRIVKYFNFVQIAQRSVSTWVYTKRDMFDHFISVLPSYEIFFKAIPAFMESQGWSEAYLLTETYPFWGPHEDVLLTNLERRNMSLAGTSKIVTPPGQVPDSKYFEMIAQEAAMSGSRIFIFNTDFAIFQACWFHRYHLYGPGFVYIIHAFSTYLPTISYYDWCTLDMLFDVMKSFIVHNDAFRMDWNPDEKDGLGITGRYFDQELKAKIVNPHHQGASWYYFRATAYDPLAAAVIAIAEVEKVLAKTNDTWKNWLSGTDNFSNKGSYIADLLLNAISVMDFKGLLTSTTANGFSAMNGDVGFSQYRYSEDVHNLEAMTLQQFALYKNGELTIINENLKWDTKDGNAPFDRMRFIDVKKEELTLEVQVPILCMSSIILIWTFFKIAINYKQMKQFRDLNLFNICCRLGIVLLIVDIITSTIPGQTTTEVTCKIGTVLSLTGVALILNSILVKLLLCRLIALDGTVKRKSTGQPLKVTTGSSRVRSSRHTRHSNFPISNMNTKSFMINQQMAPSQFKNHILLLLAISVSQLALALIWVIPLESTTTTNFYRGEEFAEGEQSIAYRYFTKTCSYSMPKNANMVFAIVIGLGYFLIGISAIKTAVIFPKNVAISNAPDIHRFQQLSYIMIMLMVGGFAVIWVMSSSGDLVKANLTITFIELIFCIAVTSLMDIRF